jgi:hypothetical protein
MAVALRRNNRPLPWRSNPVITGRIDTGIKAWAQGKSAAERLNIINAWCREKGYSEISYRTMNDDFQRGIQLYYEQASDTAETRLHQHNLRHLHLLNRMWEDLDTNMTNDNARASTYGVIQRTLAEMGKLDGTSVVHVEHKVEQKKTEGEEAQILIQVLVQRYGEDEAATVISEARKRITGEVIDIEAKEVESTRT